MSQLTMNTSFQPWFRRACVLGPIAGLLLSAAAAGCSGDDDSTPGAAAGANAGGAGGSDAGTQTNADPDAVVGTFTASLVAPTESETSGHTTLVGTVYNGTTPLQTIWEVATEADACTLYTPRVPFCSTPCGGSAVCVEDDQCQPYPTKQNVGAVRVTGVKTAAGATDFTMTAVANTYQAPTLPYPAFAEGDEISVQAAGGTFGAFSITARGIAPLTLSSSELQLTKGQALALKWPAATSAAASQVHVKLDISHHGGSKGVIECETADSGSLTIASELISGLLDLGYAGFPTIIVTRHSDGLAQVAAGSVQLTAASQVEQAVTIPGLESCSDDTDCPSGQTCQSDLTCK